MRLNQIVVPIHRRTYKMPYLAVTAVTHFEQMVGAVLAVGAVVGLVFLIVMNTDD